MIKYLIQILCSECSANYSLFTDSASYRTHKCARCGKYSAKRIWQSVVQQVELL